MTTLSTRRFLQIAGLAAAGLLLAACGKKAETPAPAPASVASAPAPAKVVVVGTDAAYAPFESQNEKGEIVGFDIEVVQAIAAKAGFEVKFVNTPWEGIFNALGQGDRDMVVSAVTITEERKQTMDFSNPYFDAQQLIAVKENSKVTKFADLKKLKVGVQTGTTGDEAVTKLQGKTSTNIKRFEFPTPLGAEGTRVGRRGRRGRRQRCRHPLRGQQPRRQVQDGGRHRVRTRAVRHRAEEEGDAELLNKVNQGLAAIKADGTYDQIFAKYFGQAPAKAADAPAPAASK